MNEQIFKVGDKVFDINYGWGKVINYIPSSLYPIGVVFNEDDSSIITQYTKNGFLSGYKYPTLSFTEYTLQGFSHKRFFDYKNCIGKWGKFWDDRIKEYIISRLERATPEGFKSNTSFILYNNFEPLTEEQIKMLNLE